MIQRLFFLLGTAAVLTGCAAPLYQWGSYEDSLYGAYKDPTRVLALKERLESHIQRMEGSRQKVAPGLYAELGTLYLQAGATQEAISLYQRERAAWPESSVLMSALIQNLERRADAGKKETP